jgi:hypothetical protein
LIASGKPVGNKIGNISNLLETVSNLRKHPDFSPQPFGYQQGFCPPIENIAARSVQRSIREEAGFRRFSTPDFAMGIIPG